MTFARLWDHHWAPAEVPEIVTLRLGCGESWTLERRWQNGQEVGVKVVGTGARPTVERTGGR